MAAHGAYRRRSPWRTGRGRITSRTTGHPSWPIAATHDESACQASIQINLRERDNWFLKFVISEPGDMDDVDEYVTAVGGHTNRVWLMPEAQTVAEMDERLTIVMDLALQYVTPYQTAGRRASSLTIQARDLYALSYRPSAMTLSGHASLRRRAASWRPGEGYTQATNTAMTTLLPCSSSSRMNPTTPRAHPNEPSDPE